MWNILTLLTIIILLVSVFIGALAAIFGLVAPILKVLFTADGIASFIGDASTFNTIDTCLNGDGNLKNSLSGNNSYTDTIEQFYNESKKLDDLFNAIINQGSSPSVQQYRSYLNKLRENFALDLTDPTKTYSGINALQSLNNITNYHQGQAVQNSGNCGDGIIYDIWVGNITDCPRDFTILNKTDPKANFGSNSCLSVTEFNSTSMATTRYSSCPGAITNDASSYLNNMNQYSLDIQNNIVNGFEKDLNM